MNPENICKRIWIFVFCKNLSNKYSQKRLNSTKKLDTIKTASKKAIQKTAHATGDLIANKITDKITSVSAELPSKKKKKIQQKIITLIMKQKYQGKDTYLQKKDNKLLMN